MALRIGWRERELQQRVKYAGGRWDPHRQVWLLRPDEVDSLKTWRKGVLAGPKRDDIDRLNSLQEAAFSTCRNLFTSESARALSDLVERITADTRASR